MPGLGGSSPGGSTPLSLGAAGTGGRTGGTSGAAASPSSSDPYSAYYTNPIAVGWGPVRQLAPSASGTTTGGTGGFGGAGGGGGGTGTTTGFSSALNSSGQIQTLKANSLAQPLYAVTTTTTGTATAVGGVTAGFSTVGIRRAPPYVTTVGFRRAPRISPAVVQADIRQALDLSPRLTDGRAIQLAVNGTTVVLQGTVPSTRQRRIAELLARMTPGVRDVRNELRVPATTTPEGE
jgi:osmotically-inducible protein OsmY